MIKSAMEMVADANAQAGKLTPQQALERQENGDVVIVDVRDGEEIAKLGKIKGSVAISRGVLEFQADPSLPFHNSALDPEKEILIYCASGGRSALAAQTLRQMGYSKATNVGGFQELIDAGFELDKPET